MEYAAQIGDIILNQIISFNKQKESPVVTITDEVLKIKYKCVVEVSDKMRLLFFRLQNINVITFFHKWYSIFKFWYMRLPRGSP